MFSAHIPFLQVNFYLTIFFSWIELTQKCLFVKLEWLWKKKFHLLNTIFFENGSCFLYCWKLCAMFCLVWLVFLLWSRTPYTKSRWNVSSCACDTALKSHMCEIYKGFHSTRPNFVLPAEVACVWDENRPVAEARLKLRAFCFGECLVFSPSGRGRAQMWYWGSNSSGSTSLTRIYWPHLI